MKPVFWIVAGAGTTLYGALKLRRATEILTPDGARDRWQAITHGATTFAHDVRDAHHLRRDELRQRYGMPALAATKTPELNTTVNIDTAHIDTAHIDTAHTESE